MKHKSPKQLRKKKRNPYIIHDLSDVLILRTEVGRSRADRLPPFDEYNPNRIHIARRRQAHKEHNTFPRAWRPRGVDKRDELMEDDCAVDDKAGQ